MISDVESSDTERHHTQVRWWGSARGDIGMATAEYAIATLAACGFAGLLVALMRSDEVRGLLFSVIQRALSLN